MNFFDVRCCSALPLKGITVEAKIHNFFNDVSFTYAYENSSEELMESTFVFPIESGCVVYRFEATIGSDKFISLCRSREEANFIYEDSMEKNKTAFVLIEDEEMTDTFSMKIGNIPPKEKVFIRLSFFQMLLSIPKEVECGVANSVLAILTIPFLLNSRYTPRWHGNKRLFGLPLKPEWSSLIPYTFHFSAGITSSSQIQSIYSPNHQLSFEYLNANKTSAKAILTSKFDFSEDFQLHISYADAQTFVDVEQSSADDGYFSSDCVLVNFLPNLPPLNQRNAEIVFIIDRSGSMDGDPIRQARQALLILLKSLPIDCRFQVVGFGSTYSMLFPEPVDNTETNVAKALEYQRALEADMGGTEVLSVLSAVYNSKSIDSGDQWRREIIFLTDGDVVNHSEVISLVAANASTSRLSAIGLGHGVSTALVSGVARAGNGRALFVREQGNLREAVLEVLNCSLQPWLTEVKVDWRLSRGGQPVSPSLQVPSEVPAVFGSTFTTISALVLPGKGPLTGEVTLSFKMSDKSFTLTASLPTTTTTTTSTDSNERQLHRFTASRRLTELLDQYGGIVGLAEEEACRAAIIDLSLAASVLCPFTAFVGLRPTEVEHSGGGVIRVKVPLGMLKQASVDFLDGVPLPPPNIADRGYSPRPGFDTINEECDKIDEVFAIAELQLFSGAWTWSHDLSQTISVPAFEKYPQILHLHDDVWTTALVLAFLHLKALKSQTEWKLMAKKARDWLFTIIGDDTLTNQVIQAASRTLATTK